MKRILTALLAFLCLEASSQCASQTVIQNSTFQGSPNTSLAPYPWTSCQSVIYAEATVSGTVNKPTFAGATFLSLNYDHTGDGTYESGSVSQFLNMPLVPGVLYTATIVLRGPSSCNAVVYAGWDSCDETAQLLWTSPNSIPAGWNTYTFPIHASQGFTYITIGITSTGSLGQSDPCEIDLGEFSLSSAATPLVVSTQLNNNTCAAGSNGTATVHATGYSPFTYSWSNGQTDSILQGVSSGTYDVTVTDSHGCIVSDSVTINQLAALNASISIIGDTLITSQSASTYQWYLNGHIINGATSRNYIPLQNGNYDVVLTDGNGCTSSPSNTIYIGNITAGINELSNAGISLYPNPATNSVTIESPSISVFTLLDLSGREIISAKLSEGSNNLNVSQVSKGIYLAKIQQGENSFCQKLIIQ